MLIFLLLIGSTCNAYIQLALERNLAFIGVKCLDYLLKRQYYCILLLLSLRIEIEIVSSEHCLARLCSIFLKQIVHSI